MCILLVSPLQLREQSKMADFNDEQAAFARMRLDENYQRKDPSPTARQRLGRFTVMCLILNRTIGKPH
jgi:hypothetical protein